MRNRPVDNTIQGTRKTLKNILLLITATGIAVAGYSGVQAIQSKPDGLYDPVVADETTTISPTSTPLIQAVRRQQIKLDKEKLQQEIQEIITKETPVGKEWVFGVVVTDLETGDQININESESFDAASVGKIPILLTLYDQIENGKVKLTDTITITDKEIQDYGTGSIRYKKTPITYSIEDLAELMIKQSDNTAASVLATKVGRANTQGYVANLNMINTDLAENTTTAYDTNLMLVHLFKMKAENPRLAGSLLNIMTDSDFEQRLPGLLEDNVIVAHKIGTGTAQIHDAGIILLEDRPIAISVFSKKINDEKKAENIIAQIAKKTVDTFQALQ